MYPDSSPRHSALGEAKTIMGRRTACASASTCTASRLILFAPARSSHTSCQGLARARSGDPGDKQRYTASLKAQPGSGRKISGPTARESRTARIAKEAECRRQLLSAGVYSGASSQPWGSCSHHPTASRRDAATSSASSATAKSPGCPGRKKVLSRKSCRAQSPSPSGPNRSRTAARMSSGKSLSSTEHDIVRRINRVVSSTSTSSICTTSSWSYNRATSTRDCPGATHTPVESNLGISSAVIFLPWGKSQM
mmetsp:Transcript_41432/g.93732  ORF Transcript_41432/g.93732 Transcript_41432/m.93732 type:complete len:252 (+) Transcript_41432:619-1374(+)